jgi:hypothetical protein
VIPTEPLFLYAVHLEDAGVEQRIVPRDEVPEVGDRVWADGREWLIQRRERSASGLCDFELDAVAIAAATA